MLILTRRAGQAVLIGDNVEVKVIAVKGNNVRLGFEAPDDVDIARAETRKEPDE